MGKNKLFTGVDRYCPCGNKLIINNKKEYLGKKYCSTICRNKGRDEQRHIGALIDVICPICGNVRRMLKCRFKPRKTNLCAKCSRKEIYRKYLSKISIVRGEKRHNWKGGRNITSKGYILTAIYPDNPYYSMSRETSGGTHVVMEHRLIMSQSLGRCLDKDERVHHRNGNKKDNRIENLQLMSKNSHYPTLHLKELQDRISTLEKIVKELESKLMEKQF